MLELLQWAVTVEWRLRGAVIREIPIAGSRVWYAEFQPLPSERQALRKAAGGEGRGRLDVPTLVLFHGLGASGTSYHAVIPHLRRAYRVVVPDLPGCGRSKPPRGREFLSFQELVEVAEKFVARVAPRGAYVAGNSMGGWIATKLASRRPDLVHAMALLNPGGPALRAEDWIDFARLILAEEKGTMQEWLDRMFHRPPFAMRLLLRDFRRIMKHPSVAELMKTLTAEDFLSEAEMARVKSPAVLVWGEKDRFIPDGCRAFYLKRLKGVRYEPLPDCGHCPQLECPNRTADILLQLRELRPAAKSSRPARAAGGGGGRAAAALPAARRRGALVTVARVPRT